MLRRIWFIPSTIWVNSSIDKLTVYVIYIVGLLFVSTILLSDYIYRNYDLSTRTMISIGIIGLSSMVVSFLP